MVKTIISQARGFYSYRLSVAQNLSVAEKELHSSGFKLGAPGTAAKMRT